MKYSRVLIPVVQALVDISRGVGACSTCGCECDAERARAALDLAGIIVRDDGRWDAEYLDPELFGA